MLAATGKYLLFADADGASDINCFARLFDELNRVTTDDLGLAVGSRHHMTEDTVQQRKWYRALLSRAFRMLMHTISGSPVNDTFCGFKLFTRKSGQLIFPAQHLERWSFDIELITLAVYHSIPIAEVPINWEEIEGSKVNVLVEPIRILRDLILIRLLYLIGVWRIGDRKV
jgi:dolichyl-phosphate beta-glucosyltransferase